MRPTRRELLQFIATALPHVGSMVAMACLTVLAAMGYNGILLVALAGIIGAYVGAYLRRPR